MIAIPLDLAAASTMIVLAFTIGPFAVLFTFVSCLVITAVVPPLLG